MRYTPPPSAFTTPRYRTTEGVISGELMVFAGDRQREIKWLRQVMSEPDLARREAARRLLAKYATAPDNLGVNEF